MDEPSISNYAQMGQEQHPSSNKSLIIGYTSQGLLYALIITYMILSYSLFSTIALIFMLIGFYVSLATPYYIENKKESQNQQLKVFAYPVERIVWALYLAINIATFGWKLYICITNTQEKYSQEWQEFLEIQSYLYMFLPLLLLPFNVGCLLIKTKTRKITEFRKKINKGFTIPIFLVLGALLLLLQIFTISVAGVFYFICLFLLIMHRKLTFTSITVHILVTVIIVVSILLIVGNYVTTSTLLKQYQESAEFQLYGINSLNDFMNSDVARGYFICLLILFLWGCLVEKMIKFTDIWSQAIKLIQPQIAGEQILREQGIREYGSIDDRNSSKTLNYSMLEEPLVEKSQKKVRGLSLRQFQLQSVHSDRHESDADQVSVRKVRSEYRGPKHYVDMSEFEKSSEDHDKKSSVSWRSRKKKQHVGKGLSEKIGESVIWAVNTFVNFIYSTEFALRVTEILSIIVIQRYNNVYSFVALLWLALVASVQHIGVIFYVTAAILLPVELGNYIIMFGYNAPYSPFAGETDLSNYGFQKMQLFWLDIIIFNLYFFYMLTYILAASKDTRVTFHKSKTKRKPAIWVLVLAFIYRYTYLLTILAIFFLGFSYVNLINLVYVILFLVFFSSGENVIPEKIVKNDKEVVILNTLARKFWYLIVYYTLLCIIGKYIYFLFFPDQLSEQLLPTGINQTYQWSFNFSLSDVCKSNTTPFFIIFILSQSQIMIYRSTIYMHYSYSLVSQSTNLKEVRKQRSLMNELLEFVMEFYYQSLYYVSGLIILVCSWQWSFFGLIISAVTCWGMLRTFSKRILASIVFLDLAYLIINYLILFVEYAVVENFIGEEVTQDIKKVGFFLGLELGSTENLFTIFGLNIVIFYFSVQSYRLAKILAQQRFTAIRSSFHDDDPHRESKNDSISQYQDTIIQSQAQDIKFAQNYNKGVILVIKKYYNVYLPGKYSWWRYFCRLLARVITDLVAIFVIICCLYYRLSVSMFYFLIIYMVYYYFLFDEIGRLFINMEFYPRVGRQVEHFKRKQAILTERKHPIPMISGEENLSSLFNFIQEIKLQTYNLRYHWKQTIWPFSSTAAVIFLLLTYSAQFLNSPFYLNYVSWDNTQTLESFLFAFGFSADPNVSYFRNAYFYYCMVVIVVVEKLLMKYVKVEKESQSSSMKDEEIINVKEYRELQDPINLINMEEDFIESVHIQHPLKQPYLQHEVPSFQEPDVAGQANILMYFQYKGTLININLINGIMMALIRFYLLMMLINLYEKSNIFAFAYLFIVLFFWFRTIRFHMIKDINKAAIAILILQYLVLLLDINGKTSSLPPPNDQNLSILNRLLSQEWIDYLIVDFSNSTLGSFMVSFLISSIIIFMTQIYLTLYMWVHHKILSLVDQIYQRYQYITQTLTSMPETDTIYLNYENYKHFQYRFTKLFYELLINNSYIVVSILILILLSSVHTWVSAVLVVFACIYIYLGVFTDLSENQSINSYTSLYFRIISFLLFAILIIITVTYVPVFDKGNNIIIEIQNLSSMSQIFLIFFIQIWIDLYRSHQFKQVTLDYKTKVKNRQNVLLKCMAYQQNMQLAKNLIKSYKQILSFEVNIIDAMHVIKQWHKMMSKNLKTSKIEVIHESVQPVTVELMRQEIREQQKKRPEDDESILDIFKRFITEQTHLPLKYRYYQIMKYIVYNNHRVINPDNSFIDIWDYVLENFEKLDDQIKEAETELDTIAKALQAEDEGFRMIRLEQIREEKYQSSELQLNKNIAGRIITPKKIFLNVKDQKESLPKMLLYFTLSNFSYFLTFFIWIYYLINPCLLSLPFIIYIFAYQIISDQKLTSIMLLYIFSIVVFSEVVQLESFYSSDWIKYFFYQTGTDSYNFVVGYLFFIFILIFVNEEINKYRGTKFRFHEEVESRAQGALRLLINEDPKSDLYLWKMKVENEDEEEKDCNPMEYFSKKIQKTPQQLTGQDMVSFFESFKQNKVGIDLYPLIASVQIFLTIYLIFFYPLMVQTDSTGLEESFKYFQFSSHMVIGVLVHVASIVLQRRITLINGQKHNKQLIKYYYTMLILSLFCLFIYYIAPRNQTVRNVYEPRGACIAFAFFYFIYFFLSGLQIRFGYKKYKSLNSIMTRRRMFNNIILIGYTAIPFLYELKTMMDWSFCETSLKIFDWFRLFSIYYSAFKAKLQFYGTTGVDLGKPLNWIMKSIGWLGFIGILIIIFGPMILFSGLNPIAQTNLVVSGSLQLGLQIQGGNYFQLYSTSHFSKPPHSFTQEQFNEMNFYEVPLLQTLTSSDIPNQFQSVSYQPFSDSDWGISYPNFETIVSSINTTIYQMENNLTVDNQFSVIVQYELNRRVSSTIAVQTNFKYPENGYLTLNHLKDLYQTFTNCNTPTYLHNFYVSLIRLNTIDNSYKPRIIPFQGSADVPYNQSIYLNLYCNKGNDTTDTNDVFWSVNITNNDTKQTTNQGIILYVLCDKYQNLIGGLGFTALYTSVILVVANFIRGMFDGELPFIPYKQNPKPDNILQICEAIGTLRVRKQFREEYLMYYQLIDIIRSPEIMKYMSGSYPVLIEEANQTRKKKLLEKEKQQEKQKIQ